VDGPPSGLAPYTDSVSVGQHVSKVAIFGLMQCSKMPLLDHLVGGRAQRSRIVSHAA